MRREVTVEEYVGREKEERETEEKAENVKE
jgi:hypothetical protein